MLQRLRKATIFGRSKSEAKTPGATSTTEDGNPCNFFCCRSCLTLVWLVESAGSGTRTVNAILDWAPVFQEVKKRKDDLKTMRSFMETLKELNEAHARGLRKLSE